MFNEKNLPKLILFTPIFFMALILMVATYIQIIDFNAQYEDETNQLQQIIINKENENNTKKQIENFIAHKVSVKKMMIEKIVVLSFIILVLMSLVAFFVSKRLTSLLNNYKKDVQKSQNELLNANLHLEERIKEKTKELEKFNQKLKNEIEKEVLKSRQKDSALFQQSKMAAIGEMLENIAHQWRQPLSTISTLASGLSLKLEYNIFTKDEAKQELQAVVDTTKKLSNTIDYFQKYFSKTNVFEDFNLSDIIKSNLVFLEVAMKSNHIDVVTNFKDDITIFGLKNEFAQVLMNILNNAKEALVNNIDIKYKRLICIDLYKKEGKTIIDITDNAGGIPIEIMDKIFEPYFSTKHKAQGVGIGLYMAQEIIVKHMKGNLTAENCNFVLDGCDYKGAKFTIILDIQEQSN